MNISFQEKRVLLVILFSFLLAQFVFAQNIYNPSQKSFRNAVELYNRGLYTSAEAELDKIAIGFNASSGLDLAEIESYKTLCSIELKRSNLDGIVAAFLAKYPYSAWTNKVYLKYASIYFDNKDYIKAYEYFVKIKKNELSEKDIIDYSFKMGYCNLRVGKIDEALKEFDEIIYKPVNSYTSPSQYYSAYILYIK